MHIFTKFFVKHIFSLFIFVCFFRLVFFSITNFMLVFVMTDSAVRKKLGLFSNVFIKLRVYNK